MLFRSLGARGGVEIALIEKVVGDGGVGVACREGGDAGGPLVGGGVHLDLKGDIFTAIEKTEIEIGG